MSSRDVLRELDEQRRRERRSAVKTFIQSGILQELIRGGSNVAVAAVQAGGNNPMMASGSVILGAGVAHRVGLVDKPTKFMAQGAALGYIGAEAASGIGETIGEIIGAFTGTAPAPAAATQITYDMPGGEIARPAAPAFTDAEFQDRVDREASKLIDFERSQQVLLIEAAKLAVTKEAASKAVSGGAAATAGRGVVAPKATFLPTVGVLKILDSINPLKREAGPTL